MVGRHLKKFYYDTIASCKRGYLKILYQTGLLERINFTVTKSVLGRSVRIPFIKGIGYENFYLSERWMLPLFSALIKGRVSGSFVDVGVNIGQTLIKLKYVAPQMKYFGFEANPSCFFYIRELISANGWSDVTIFPLALFSETTLLELDFFSGGVTDSGASLIHGFRPEHKIVDRQSVAAFRFADVDRVVHVDSPQLVKIDVEGAELEVLKSMSEFLTAKRPILLLELLPVQSSLGAIRDDRLSRQKEAETRLRGLNYRIFRVEKKGQRLIGIRELDAISIHSDLNLCDYVLLPAEFDMRSIDAALPIL